MTVCDATAPGRDIAFFIDAGHQADDFLAEVVDGLGAARKFTPPKFFYDSAGSRLFEEICKTPEYYVTRTELGLLAQIGPELGALVPDRAVVVEYGCGSSAKIRLLLGALADPAEYIGIDIARERLLKTAREIAGDFPGIRVGAICADFAASLAWPEEADPALGRRLAFFPGSTIGNMAPDEARVFLGRVRDLIGAGGAFLVGVDLEKDTAILDAAYNDAAGHTAAFNLNLLERMRRELGAEVEPGQFAHRAFYNAADGRIEMHLVSRREQAIRIGSRVFEFATGEAIHTENSYKYSTTGFADLARAAGFEREALWVDDRGLFSIHYLRAG
jgi:dimethylhistidine N-methyltransferase